MNLPQQISNNELSVIQILINIITKRTPTFHKLTIHIRNDSSDIMKFSHAYDALKIEKGWKIKSQKNKAKLKKLKLDNNKSVTLQVYPRGKIVLAIKCSQESFDFSNPDSSREFFETIGVIYYRLIKEFGKTYLVPLTGNWLLKQYDRDVTLVTSELERKYPCIRNWYSREGVRISALGHVFQIYGKIMPRCGKCLRFEDNVTIRNDMTIEQAISEAINRPLEIIKLLESASKETSTRY